MISLKEYINNYLEQAAYALYKNSDKKIWVVSKMFNRHNSLYVDVAYSNTDIETKVIYNNKKGYYFKVKGLTFYLKDFKYPDGKPYLGVLDISKEQKRIEEAQCAIDKKKAELPKLMKMSDIKAVGLYKGLQGRRFIYFGKVIVNIYNDKSGHIEQISKKNGFAYRDFHHNDLSEETMYRVTLDNFNILKSRRKCQKELDRVPQNEINKFLKSIRLNRNTTNNGNYYYEYEFLDLGIKLKSKGLEFDN